MPSRRPTAAGLAAALGLPAPDETPPASPPVPEAVVDAAPQPAAPSEAAPVMPVTRRPGRMGGVVVPAAAPVPVAEAAPVEPPAPREHPTTPRPVLLRSPDGVPPPVPPEWLNERGQPFAGWWLTDDEMRALVDAAPPGRTCRETWPGCESQLCPVTVILMAPSPFADWVSGSRQPIMGTCYRKKGRA